MMNGLLGLAALSLLLLSTTAHAAPVHETGTDLSSTAPLFVLAGLALAGGSLCRRRDTSSILPGR